MSTVERRQSPRVKKTIPIKVKIPGTDLVAQTKDISSLGAFCSIKQNIPLMTKLGITLLLPEHKKVNNKIPHKITCQGVILRSEESPKDNLFHIAIFFTQIREKDRLLLESFIEHHIKKENLQG